jgi:hypothetical protein
MTDTIKERAVYVYLPTLEMAESWKSGAKKAGVSVSKYVTDRVEDSMRREEGEKGGEGYLSRLDLIRKLGDAQEELKKLREENRLLKRLSENLDRELKRHRAKPFTEEGFQGVRQFDKELVELLRKGGSLGNEEIITKLGIEPSDAEMIRAVGRQLEALQGYGLVEYTGRGWRWKG